MKCAIVFACALLSIRLAFGIRTEDAGMDEVGAKIDGFVELAFGKWCEHSQDESAGVTDEGYDLEKCRKACADESSCVFFCFDSNADWCATYKTCDNPTETPNDFDQDSSGWTIYKKAAEQDATIERDDLDVVGEQDDTISDKHEQEERAVELPACECAEDNYQQGSATGDIMCAFQGGKNCALSKGSCPKQAVQCRKPEFEASEQNEGETSMDEDVTQTGNDNEIPECTCAEDNYQQGSATGDIMCAFQGGRNCAVSKGSCPKQAVQCRKPDFEASEQKEVETSVDEDVSQGGNANQIPKSVNGDEIPECTCAKGSYQMGSATGDIMCAFQRGKNCAASKGSCPKQATACRKPDFEAIEEKEVEAPGSDFPLCTCDEDKYQQGSQSGDTMCAFQGGKNCAKSKGSCPEGRAVACKKP